MNWRGRPLTSHEVIINTIAATTTRTGLRVAAGLDPGSYPAGIKISDEQMAALAITRHDWHGDWNYTLHPAPPCPAAHGAGAQAAPPPPPDRSWLHSSPLTGLTPAQWARMIEKLGIARHAQREADLHDRRGGTRQAAAGTGRHAVLTLDDRVALTLLDLRFSLPKPLLENLYGVSRTTINKTIGKTRPLLILTGYTPETTSTRFSNLTELVRFVEATGIPVPPEIKTAC